MLEMTDNLKIVAMIVSSVLWPDKAYANDSQSEPLCGSTEAKSHVQSASSMTLQVGQLCLLSPLTLSIRSQDRKMSQSTDLGHQSAWAGYLCALV